MAFAGMLLLNRPSLVIKIVQQRGDSPELFVRSRLAGIGAHASFDGQGVFAQVFVLSEFAEQGPGVVSRGHHNAMIFLETAADIKCGVKKCSLTAAVCQNELNGSL